MKINLLPSTPPRVLLAEIPTGSTFVVAYTINRKAPLIYVKHNVSGLESYKCYSLTDCEWKTLSENLWVIKCEVEINVTLV